MGEDEFGGVGTAVTVLGGESGDLVGGARGNETVQANGREEGGRGACIRFGARAEEQRKSSGRAP